MNQLQNFIWSQKYKSSVDTNYKDTFNRLIKAISPFIFENEKHSFSEIFNNFLFLPGGRILASSGTDNQATLSNCYVMPQVEDSLNDIMEHLKLSALTMKAGGGIGVDFSKIRPEKDLVKTTNCQASGPVSFMHLWDTMCQQVSGYGLRRGAILTSLRIDHPDIEKFIKAKQNNSPTNKVLSQCNMSVAVTDKFMKCLEAKTMFELKFNGIVYKEIDPEILWNLIIENSYNYAEPGILFIDRINYYNNLYYLEKIATANPCGEQPLPEYGSCNLGSINLVKFIIHPFTENASFDFEKFKSVISLAVKYLDTILDLNYYPLEAQKEQALNSRRIGLGITGLGSALAMLNLKYGSDESLVFIQKLMSIFTNTAYQASSLLAKIKGSFPQFDSEKYLNSNFLKILSPETVQLIEKFGIRNSHVVSIAPTGSISQFMGNVSSGIEPIYELQYKRTNGDSKFEVMDYAYYYFRELYGSKKIPPSFITAHEVTPEEHLKVLSVCQKYIDSGISKTINIPKTTSLGELKDIYKTAYSLGCKGVTIYRDGSLENVLTKITEPEIKKSVYKRPYRLQSFSYKVKLPTINSAYYIHCSFYYDKKLKQNKPIEVFINTKAADHEEFLKALGRIISAIFRNSENPSFLIDELKDVHAKTGFLSNHRQKYVPSLIAEIGEVLKDFFIDIGIYNQEYKPSKTSRILFCPQCNVDTIFSNEKCPQCLECGYSKCD